MRISAEVDELAMVRSRIARLREREAELSARLIAGDAAMRQGRWTVAHLREDCIRVFDHRLLPLDLQADAHYWRERTKIVVELSLRDGPRAPLPGAGGGPRTLTIPPGPDCADAAFIALTQQGGGAWN
ncbi:hypothetical protein [Pararhodobacter marinus]|uniref:Uncharacterized protein n=1 Tax=Pararhodobacter marinus TaxID=2184063 RepID=A0A2U2CGM3_9RHOB|nr:hypothetical protein [Pararhodobacter marinus]PWE31043.1 hypothetical protein C4N9_04645 [Pararhodobacter marinus]